MPPRFCCCGEPGCDIANDNFDRADSTNLGAQWDEVSGDWEIASNKLTIDEVGIIRNLAVNEFGTNSMYISAKIYNFQDNTKYRIILQMNDDGTQYYFAEWHHTTGGSFLFSIGDETTTFESTGPDTLSEGTQINASMTAKNQLCMSDTGSRLTACVTPKPQSTHKWGGLAAGTSAGATFDDYIAFATTAESVDCQACDCTCDGWCIPDALIATFQELNECPVLDGLTSDLDNSSLIKFGSGWLQSAGFACSVGGGTIDFRLECSETGLPTLIITNTPDAGTFLLDADPLVSTCHPLSLRFGPVDFGAVSGCGTTSCCGGNPCGSGPGDTSLFYIWITKRISDYDYDNGFVRAGYSDSGYVL